MRIKVTCQLERPVVVPLNYQHLLTGAVYRFLQDADADYAQFLHDTGYRAAPSHHAAALLNDAPSVTETRRFKLFTFSLLRAQQSHLRMQNPADPELCLQPGSVTWWIASPVEKFVKEFATGLLAAGALQVGRACLPIAQVETVAAPEFKETMRGRCLSPIVAAVTEESDGRRRTRYLRPKDPGWSERLRANLLGKHAAPLSAIRMLDEVVCNEKVPLTLTCRHVCRKIVNNEI